MIGRVTVRGVRRIAGDSNPAWGAELPATITSLECSLTAAFHAFDDIESMSMAHRVRVVDEISALVPEAASAAARAGHGNWAEVIVRTAAERPPAWSLRCTRWDGLITASLVAIDELIQTV